MKSVSIFLFAWLFSFSVLAQMPSLRDDSLDRDGRSDKKMKSLNEDSIQSGSRIDYTLLPAFEKSRVTNEKRKRLIEQQIDSRQKSGLGPVLRIEPPNVSPSEIMSEGTGTRGGGSGILTTSSSGAIKVTVLDIYRSENQQDHPKFFQLDPELVRIASEHPADVADEMIYTEVLNRLRRQLPTLTKKIENVAAAMPFSKWTASISHLPLLDDYIGDLKLATNQEHIQIAYRRNNQVIYNEEMWKAMDGLNRAALRLHEYVYAIVDDNQSVQVQRFISLLFSSRFPKIESDQERETYLFETGVLGAAMQKLFLTGSEVTNEPAGPEEVCGYAHAMTVDPATRTAGVQIAVQNSIRKIKLNLEETKNFLLSTYAAKAYLGAQFSSVFYPAQQLSRDIICIDDNRNRISSFEIGVVYDPVKSEQELKSAKLEAQYFQAQYKLVQAERKAQAAQKNRDLRYSTLQVEALELKLAFLTAASALNDQALVQTLGSHPLMSINRVKTLGKLRIKF